MYTEKDVKKAMKGHKKSIEKIMENEKGRLYRIAYLYVKNEDNAVDIVQDAVYKAYISIHRVKDPLLFSAWLKRITINCALDFLKQQKKVVPLINEIVESIPTKTVEVDGSLDLYNAIDQLNERHKSIIILKYYEDLPNKEIAEILDCPEGTVKSNLHRALQLLRGYLKEDCINE
ncbi:sigma-70 family RNA polymerase sigma factor [Bacillus suaedaesalsae]|uniref:Sigma-70 family RNA polymerase sigma factor n=1 Tax=Bacillus suaedaesalsae TaxID=2810349 RepID=A0ABS2DG16_9BACI|nr:sigma-70 family RNA polymerase sigma factor [Bacillus suaedaesalsae]MBM6617403.1 sigma-70 family RNA polymerase sigma factor [Bacillus suaedaesalsae]